VMGFIASMAPQIWTFIVQKWGGVPSSDATTMQTQAATLQADAAIIASQQATIADQQTTIGKLTADIHHPWVTTLLKFLQTSVRPVLTYGFFLVWAAIKLIALWHGLHTDHVAVTALLPVVFDDDSEALFASIITFWFGSRQMNGTKTKPK